MASNFSCRLLRQQATIFEWNLSHVDTLRMFAMLLPTTEYTIKKFPSQSKSKHFIKFRHHRLSPTESDELNGMNFEFSNIV